MMIVSQKESPEGLLIVVTDSDLIGKTFEEGKKHLDLTKKYYLGEEMDKAEIKKLIKFARHIVLTGKEAVAMGIELDLLMSDKILYVNKVPHAQIVTG